MGPLVCQHHFLMATASRVNDLTDQPNDPQPYFEQPVRVNHHHHNKRQRRKTYPPPNSIPRLKNRHFSSILPQDIRASQPGQTGTNNRHFRNLAHGREIWQFYSCCSLSVLCLVKDSVVVFCNWSLEKILVSWLVLYFFYMGMVLLWRRWLQDTD